MNKRIAAYTVAAVLLGFAVMMVPLVLETGPPTYIPPQIFPPFSQSMAESKLPTMDTQPSAVLGGQPLNLLPSSIVFFSGLIVALAAYTIIKRRPV